MSKKFLILLLTLIILFSFIFLEKKGIEWNRSKLFENPPSKIFGEKKEDERNVELLTRVKEELISKGYTNGDLKVIWGENAKWIMMSAETPERVEYLKRDSRAMIRICFLEKSTEELKKNSLSERKMESEYVGFMDSCDNLKSDGFKVTVCSGEGKLRGIEEKLKKYSVSFERFEKVNTSIGEIEITRGTIGMRVGIELPNSKRLSATMYFSDDKDEFVEVLEKTVSIYLDRKVDSIEEKLELSEEIAKKIENNERRVEVHWYEGSCSPEIKVRWSERKTIIILLKKNGKISNEDKQAIQEFEIQTRKGKLKVIRYDPSYPPKWQLRREIGNFLLEMIFSGNFSKEEISRTINSVLEVVLESSEFSTIEKRTDELMKEAGYEKEYIFSFLTDKFLKLTYSRPPHLQEPPKGAIIGVKDGYKSLMANYYEVRVDNPTEELKKVLRKTRSSEKTSLIESMMKSTIAKITDEKSGNVTILGREVPIHVSYPFSAPLALYMLPENWRSWERYFEGEFWEKTIFVYLVSRDRLGFLLISSSDEEEIRWLLEVLPIMEEGKVMTFEEILEEMMVERNSPER